jgi:hypothetical protein
MLLANVLRTLSEGELKKIREGFKLTERPRLIFERIAASSSAPPDLATLAKGVNTTKENIYRLCSEIVDECIRILAPKEEFSTLKFFRDRYLYRPFVTELHRIEKRLIEKRDKVLLERLYEFGFLELGNFPVSVIDLDILEEMGNKWHRIKKILPLMMISTLECVCFFSISDHYRQKSR